MMERKDKENCSNVSNSMLTDVRNKFKKKDSQLYWNLPEQLWGKSTIHGVLIY